MLETRVQPRSRLLRSVVAASVVAAGTAVLATAAPFPAQHFPLTPVAGEPLHDGFAEVIHPEGPEVYARHVYQVNGARSNETYGVVISIWTTSLECTGDPTFVLPVAELATNGSGNGRADVVHGPELLAALGLRGLTIGGDISLLRDGSPAYATGCKVVELD
jgi:hypothetical protein